MKITLEFEDKQHYENAEFLIRNKGKVNFKTLNYNMEVEKCEKVKK